MKVLVVDDSVVFRSQIKAALAEIPGIEIVGAVANGKIALDYLKKDSTIDLLTLDMEMPVMDGIATLKEIQNQKINVKVLVFSASTSVGADKTLEALRYGAADFVAKPSGKVSNLEEALGQVKKQLIPKILQFQIKDPGAVHVEGGEFLKIDVNNLKPKVVVIGSSTGGPGALEVVFGELKGPLNCPILITQHMPPVFTASLAKRLGQISGIPAGEGKMWEALENKIYVAPGNYHMKIGSRDGGKFITLDQGPLRCNIRPAVDNLFESAAECYGRQVGGMVLTGMGADGLEGCLALKKMGSGVAIQSKESCIVFGMPGAVYAAKAYDLIGDLGVMSELLNSWVKV